VVNFFIFTNGDGAIGSEGDTSPVRHDDFAGHCSAPVLGIDQYASASMIVMIRSVTVGSAGSGEWAVRDLS
jgi:hypothetical protein